MKSAVLLSYPYVLKRLPSQVRILWPYLSFLWGNYNSSIAANIDVVIIDLPSLTWQSLTWSYFCLFLCCDFRAKVFCRSSLKPLNPDGHSHGMPRGSSCTLTGGRGSWRLLGSCMVIQARDISEWVDNFVVTDYFICVYVYKHTHIYIYTYVRVSLIPSAGYPKTQNFFSATVMPQCTNSVLRDMI